MGFLDGVGSLLSRNSIQPTTTNSAYDISALTSELKSAGFNISVNGRSLNKDLDPKQIETLYSGVAQAAIQLTAFKVAKMIEEYRKVVHPDDPKEYLEEQHPYHTAISKAPYSNLFFWRSIAEYVLAMGNAYVYTGERKLVAGDGFTYKMPERFEVLETPHVTVVKSRKTKKIIGYKYDKEGSDLKGQDILADNVIAIRDLNIFDLEKGRGLLSSIARNLLIEDQATLLQYAALINGTSIPGFVTVDPETPSDIYENIKQSISQRWTGVKTDKAGAPVVMKGGKIEWKPINVEYDKLAMDGLREGNDNVIRSRLGVSKTIMGQEESGVTRDTSETMTENFEDNNCLLLATLILDGFNQDYVNHYEKQYDSKPLEMVVALPERRKADEDLKKSETVEHQVKALSTLVTSGFDPEAACEVVGLDPIKYIGTPSLRTPETDSKQEQQRKQLENERRTDKNSINAVNSFCSDHGCHTNAFDPSTMTDGQKALAAAIAALDSRLLPLYLSSLDTDIPTVKRTEIQNDLKDVLYGYSTSTTATLAPARYAELLAKHGGTGSYTMTQRTFNELLDQASKASLSHLDTIDANVKRIVAEVAKEELGESMAKARIEEYFKNTLTEYEAQRLAVDQSRRVFGEAKLLSDKQFLLNNNLTGHKILRNYGPNPCPYCQAAEGKRVPLEKNFYDLDDVISTQDENGNMKAYKIGYAPVSSGKIHPFCGCDYELEID